MKTKVNKLMSTTLILFLFSSSHAFAERISSAPQLCRGASATSLNATTAYSRSTGGTIYCPITRYAHNSEITDADIVTSNGVEVGEVRLYEYNYNGSYLKVHSPYTRNCGDKHCHSFQERFEALYADKIYRPNNNSHLFFRISGQNNDRIYSYSYWDASVHH